MHSAAAELLRANMLKKKLLRANAIYLPIPSISYVDANRPLHYIQSNGGARTNPAVSVVRSLRSSMRDHSSIADETR